MTHSINAQNCNFNLGPETDVPYITIPVVFHSIANDNGGNLNCIPSSQFNAIDVLQPAIDFANLKFSSPDVNEFGNAGPVGDTYLRFEETLTCDNFRFYPSGTTDVNFVPDAFNIKLFDTESSSAGGAAAKGGSSMEIYNLVKFVADGSYNHFNYAKLFMHEYGHTLALDHSYCEQNPCNNIDLPAVEECGAVECPDNNECPDKDPTIGYPGNVGSGCNTSTDLCCYCTRNNGNNIMASGDQNALTPCQHDIMMNNLLVDNPRAYLCNGVPELPYEFIQSGQRVTWNTTQVKNRTIVVESGASLEIACTVLMGSNKRIIVERGGKLILANGTIKDLCGEGWFGIYVEGNFFIDQPDNSVINADLYALPQANEAGIFYGSSGAIMGAGTAINAEGGVPWAKSRWGGVIKCVDTQFINNQKAINFNWYPKSNKSQFINCQFTSDNDQDQGVAIWQCRDLIFEGNTFSNLRTGITGVDFGAYIRQMNRFIECEHAIEVFSTGIAETEVLIGEDASVANIGNEFISSGSPTSVGIIVGCSLSPSLPTTIFSMKK